MGTAAGRAGLQLVESGFLIGSLIVVLEWALPMLQRHALDMRELSFACVFGVLIVIAQTIVAYLRPASKAELVQQIEGILYEEERLRTSPRTDFLQLKQWAREDPTWATTTPGMPAMPPRRH